MYTHIHVYIVYLSLTSKMNRPRSHYFDHSSEFLISATLRYGSYFVYGKKIRKYGYGYGYGYGYERAYFKHGYGSGFGVWDGLI